LSRSKFKVTKGPAFFIAPGEPVFVKEVNGDTASVVRLVLTQNSSEYIDETYPVDQLETRYEQAKRAIEFEEFLQELREDAQKKRFALPAQMKLALENNAGKVQSINQSKG